MKRPKLLEEVKARIHNANQGTVFIPSDFFDIAEAVKINKSLERLVESGNVKRIKRGIYYKPRYSDLLGEEILPKIDEVAKAIARNYGWTIAPYGDTALNMLGLSTQVPAVWIYISDGPYKSYEISRIKLKFKHTDNKNELISLSHKSVLVIHALKALGKNNVTEKDIAKISNNMTQIEKQAMIEETKRITAWVYDFIRKICKKEESYG